MENLPLNESYWQFLYWAFSDTSDADTLEYRPWLYVCHFNLFLPPELLLQLPWVPGMAEMIDKHLTTNDQNHLQAAATECYRTDSHSMRVIALDDKMAAMAGLSISPEQTVPGKREQLCQPLLSP